MGREEGKVGEKERRSKEELPKREDVWEGIGCWREWGCNRYGETRSLRERRSLATRVSLGWGLFFSVDIGLYTPPQKSLDRLVPGGGRLEYSCPSYKG